METSLGQASVGFGWAHELTNVWWVLCGEQSFFLVSYHSYVCAGTLATSALRTSMTSATASSSASRSSGPLITPFCPLYPMFPINRPCCRCVNWAHRELPTWWSALARALGLHASMHDPVTLALLVRHTCKTFLCMTWSCQRCSETCVRVEKSR